MARSRHTTLILLALIWALVCEAARRRTFIVAKTPKGKRSLVDDTEGVWYLLPVTEGDTNMITLIPSASLRGKGARLKPETKALQKNPLLTSWFASPEGDGTSYSIHYDARGQRGMDPVLGILAVDLNAQDEIPQTSIYPVKLEPEVLEDSVPVENQPQVIKFRSWELDAEKLKATFETREATTKLDTSYKVRPINPIELVGEFLACVSNPGGELVLKHGVDVNEWPEGCEVVQLTFAWRILESRDAVKSRNEKRQRKAKSAREASSSHFETQSGPQDLPTGSDTQSIPIIVRSPKTWTRLKRITAERDSEPEAKLESTVNREKNRHKVLSLDELEEIEESPPQGKAEDDGNEQDERRRANPSSRRAHRSRRLKPQDSGESKDGQKGTKRKYVRKKLKVSQRISPEQGVKDHNAGRPSTGIEEESHPPDQSSLQEQYLNRMLGQYQGFLPISTRTNPILRPLMAFRHIQPRPVWPGPGGNTGQAHLSNSEARKVESSLYPNFGDVEIHLPGFDSENENGPDAQEENRDENPSEEEQHASPPQDKVDIPDPNRLVWIPQLRPEGPDDDMFERIAGRGFGLRGGYRDERDLPLLDLGAIEEADRGVAEQSVRDGNLNLDEYPLDDFGDFGIVTGERGDGEVPEDEDNPFRMQGFGSPIPGRVIWDLEDGGGAPVAGFGEDMGFLDTRRDGFPEGQSSD